MPTQTAEFIQAAASDYLGFTLREDFQPDVEDYLANEARFFTRLRKKPAGMDVVKHLMKTSRPVAGPVPKDNLAAVIQQPNNNTDSRVDFDDAGQEVKAIGGLLKWGDYARSLAAQQNQPFGDKVAEDTDDLLISTAQDIERQLFSGNATANPLEFNGIARQMAPNGARQHIFNHDNRPGATETLTTNLLSVSMRIMASRDIRRRLTAIMTSIAGYNQLMKEVEAKRLTMENTEYIPGVSVPGIRLANGIVPIVTSLYLDDDATPADYDLVKFWLLDEDLLEWRYVPPVRGRNVPEPQIFELVDGEHMVSQRMSLAYGTLVAKHRGEGISLLNVKVPNGQSMTYTG